VAEAKPYPLTAPVKIDIRGPNSTLETLKETVAPTLVAITSASGELLANELQVTAETSGPAKSVQATVGDQSFPLTLVGSVWKGVVPLAQLAGVSTVTIAAADEAGQVTLRQLAGFTDSIQKNYHALAETANNVVNFFGMNLNLKQFQQTFYSLFIAAILFIFMLAIAIRPRLQYWGMLAHTSVVVLLATLLWISG